MTPRANIMLVGLAWALFFAGVASPSHAACSSPSLTAGLSRPGCCCPSDPAPAPCAMACTAETPSLRLAAANRSPVPSPTRLPGPLAAGVPGRVAPLPLPHGPGDARSSWPNPPLKRYLLSCTFRL